MDIQRRQKWLLVITANMLIKCLQIKLLKSMLNDLEKNHLNKLLERYSFEYLRPPPEVYEITIPEDQLFLVAGSDRRRRIFYKVQYEEKQIEAIGEVKKKLKEKVVHHPFSDSILLKHIYASKWSIGKTVDRIQKLFEYHTGQKMMKFDDQTIQVLESGQFYTYGYDKGLRPNVIIRIDKINFKESLQNNFSAFYNLMLVVLAFRMVPYHSEKYNMIMDFNNISLADIPYVLLYEALDLMGLFYCCTTQKTFLFNSEGISNIWKVVSFFLTESQKKRAIFINKGQESKMLQYVDEYELQRRYGGKLANLTTYWPPKNTNQSFDIKMNEEKLEQSFYSVQNNDDYFEILSASTPFCSTPSCECSIY